MVVVRHHQGLASAFMRCGAAMLSLVTSITAAAAADWYTGASPAKPSSDWIVAVDASTTISSDGTAFASVGGTMSLDKGLDVSGSRLRLEGLAGTFKFNSTVTDDRIKGQQEGASVLAGYEWKSPGRSLAVFGGIEVRNTQFSPVEDGTGTPGARQGLKATIEYYRTLSDNAMLFAFGSYSGIYSAYYGQLKLGIAPIEGVFVGPEFAALGDDYYQQWRFGGHITGLEFSGMQFGISAGYQLNKTGTAGTYGTVNVRGVY